jgi:hypothetical protein
MRFHPGTERIIFLIPASCSNSTIVQQTALKKKILALTIMYMSRPSPSSTIPCSRTLRMKNREGWTWYGNNSNKEEKRFCTETENGG